ncbi:MAG: MiaB/RimO family radical SAM methylthiotransferase [Phycisphaerales bacterium]|nr:MiaB/RimO family radical SAM methylthiotransferase [Phycisphaerales bacterium]
MERPTISGEAFGPAVYLETFGCQMNELDSELVAGHLRALGYRFTDDRTAADIVLFNTCSVRQQAENKVLSRIGRLKIEKAEGRRVVLGVLGCLAEREGARLLADRPEVDLLCGPGELDRLPMLLDNILKNDVVDQECRMALQGGKSRRTATLAAAEDSLASLDLSRAFDPDQAGGGGRAAYVRITRGCNKFCTYCVVPNTRGAEVHRPPDAIVAECKRLADAGVIEVTLLGQTVNHYVYVHGAAVGADGCERDQVGPGLAAFRKADRGGGGRRVTTFADLLARIHEEVPGIQRLRFVTSYPRDFGDDVLAVMRDAPRICRYLHVPAQSGSDRILKAMNRGYTVAEYMEFIDRVLGQLPDAGIAGDIIVGFPTETEADFEATCSLVQSVPFKNNFVFKYSPRPGTVAIDRLADDVPEHVKRSRINHLLDLQSEVSRAVHAREIGKVHHIFVEKRGQEMARQGGVQLGWEEPSVQVSGRTPGDLITVFPVENRAAADAIIGRIVPVRVESAAPRLLRGRLVGDPGEHSGGHPEEQGGQAGPGATGCTAGENLAVSRIRTLEDT